VFLCCEHVQGDSKWAAGIPAAIPAERTTDYLKVRSELERDRTGDRGVARGGINRGADFVIGEKYLAESTVIKAGDGGDVRKPGSFERECLACTSVGQPLA
jgi:hypothetical protein